MSPPLLHVSDHPLVAHKVTRLRRAETETAEFRSLLREISLLLAYEATRDLPLRACSVTTPVGTAQGRELDFQDPPAVISVLRAGNGMVDGFLELLPGAAVGHVGVCRHPKTLEAIEYYLRLPPRMEARHAIVIDPMLATGNSAIAALTSVKRSQPRSLRFVCVIAAPEGVAALGAQHPEVAILAAALDERLNEKGYIVPGLGDAGDRLFGT
jgi:uracil phosphoribosyltransferase